MPPFDRMLHHNSNLLDDVLHMAFRSFKNLHSSNAVSSRKASKLLDSKLNTGPLYTYPQSKNIKMCVSDRNFHLLDS